MTLPIEWGNERSRKGFSDGVGADRRPFITPVVSDADYRLTGSRPVFRGSETLRGLARECRDRLNTESVPSETSRDPTRPPAPCLRAYNKQLVVRRECIPTARFVEMMEGARWSTDDRGRRVSGWQVGCGGNAIRPEKLDGAKRNLERDGYIAPILEVGRMNGCRRGPNGRRFSLGEGNHRTQALVDMGARCIPVIVQYDPRGFVEDGPIGEGFDAQHVPLGQSRSRALDPSVQRRQDRIVGAFAVVGIVSALAAIAVKQR